MSCSLCSSVIVASVLLMFLVTGSRVVRIDEARHRRRLCTNNGFCEMDDSHRQREKWLLGRATKRKRRSRSKESTPSHSSTRKQKTTDESIPSSSRGMQRSSQSISKRTKSSTSERSSFRSKGRTMSSSSTKHTKSNSAEKTKDTKSSSPSGSTTRNTKSKNDNSSSRRSNTKSSAEKNDGSSSSTGSKDTNREDSNTYENIESWVQSEIPTSMPTEETTMIPASSSLTKCRIEQANGDFRNTTTTKREVTFLYQVETVPNVTSSFLNTNLLSVVETAIADILLAVFFKDCRETDIASQRGNIVDFCEASGYSTLPDDRVRLGADCVWDRSDQLNNCFVVDGGVGLFFESTLVCPDAANRAKLEIKSAMANGAFDELDDRIVKVTYIKDFDFDPNTDVNVVEGSDTAREESSQFPVYAWALVALGGILLILIIAVIVKHHQLAKKDIELNNIELESFYEYDSVSLEEYLV